MNVLCAVFQIHLKPYLDSRYSAMEPREEVLQLLRESETQSGFVPVD